MTSRNCDSAQLQGKDVDLGLQVLTNKSISSNKREFRKLEFESKMLKKLGASFALPSFLSSLSPFLPVNSVHIIRKGKMKIEVKRC
jgi:hypothetical protein